MVVSQEQLGNRLREVRERAGLSQKDVAEELDLPSHSALSKIERGQQKIDSIQLQALSDLYGVTLDELLAKEVDKEKENIKFIQALRKLRQANGVEARDIKKIEEFCQYYQWLQQEVGVS